MASAAHDQAAGDLNAHANAIDQLHQRLAAAPGVDKQRLQHAVDKLKSSFAQFRDDALACMN
jgi:hypothetical protein